MNHNTGINWSIDRNIDKEVKKCSYHRSRLLLIFSVFDSLKVISRSRRFGYFIYNGFLVHFIFSSGIDSHVNAFEEFLYGTQVISARPFSYGRSALSLLAAIIGNQYVTANPLYIKEVHKDLPSW